MECPICGTDNDNRIFIVKEMQMGLREEFEYVECSNCGCLFIKEIPKNIDKYYDTNYAPHKHKKGLFNRIAKKFYGLYIANNRLIKLIYKNNVTITTSFWNGLSEKKLIDKNSSILDVGCGDGDFLESFKEGGFKDLTGIDLFINDKNMSEDITIYKTSLEDFKSDKKYDLITSIHSFEHMDNQLINLKCFENLVSDNGIIVISIPIKSDFFWKKYGVNWYQIDAPRHFFLHTIESFKILCNKTNLSVVDIICDSLDTCIMNCEKYSRDISMRDDEWNTFKLDEKDMRKFKKQIDELNANNEADQAIFVLKLNK